MHVPGEPTEAISGQGPDHHQRHNGRAHREREGQQRLQGEVSRGRAPGKPGWAAMVWRGGKREMWLCIFNANVNSLTKYEIVFSRRYLTLVLPLLKYVIFVFQHNKFQPFEILENTSD